MKGVLLAGGLGTRLYPVTREVNKHVLLVYDRPMFYWPLKTLMDSGIKEIAVVSGPPFGNQIKALIPFFPKRKGIKISFIVQEKPLGMPDAIYKCKRFAQDQSIIVVAADNYFDLNFKKELSPFKGGALTMLRKVKNPEAFAVPIYRGKKLIKIEEKPKKPKTSWAVTGPCIYDNNVFKYIETLKPSKRGELEISDLNTLYLTNGNLKLKKTGGFWKDMGSFDALLETSNFIKKKYEK